MAVDECALCGGELEEEGVEEDRESKIRGNSPDIEDHEKLHALVCQECGHVSYRRS